jgi:hypothetical protein
MGSLVRLAQGKGESNERRMKIPDAELVALTVEKLAELETRKGASAVGEIARPVLVISRAMEVLADGGFRNFFEQGLPLSDTAAACARIGANATANALRGLADLMPASEMPADYDQRMELVDATYRQHSSQIWELEAAYVESSKMLIHELAAWIRGHGFAFP